MKALVVVNYQNDYVVGPMWNKYAEFIEQNICRRIEDYLADRGEVFFVMDSFPQNYLDTPEGRRNPIKHCIRGTPGEDLYGKVKNYSSKGHMIRKEAPGSVELMKKLKSYDQVEICGLETNHGVLANAVLARTVNPNSTVIVRENCVAARDSLLAEEAMHVMESLGIVIE